MTSSYNKSIFNSLIFFFFLLIVFLPGIVIAEVGSCKVTNSTVCENEDPYWHTKQCTAVH